MIGESQGLQPHNRARGSEREAPNGRRFATRGVRRTCRRKQFESRRTATASGKIVDHGLDARRRGARDGSGEAAAQISELMKRFGPGEAGCRPDRNRGAMDSKRAPSERDKRKFYEMFPNAARIGSPSQDGERDWARRGQYEV